MDMVSEKRDKMMAMRKKFLESEQHFETLLQKEEQSLEVLQEKMTAGMYFDSETMESKKDQLYFLNSLFHSYQVLKQQVSIFSSEDVSEEALGELPHHTINNYHRLFVEEGTLPRSLPLMGVVMQSMKDFLRKMRRLQQAVSASGTESSSEEACLNYQLKFIRGFLQHVESRLLQALPIEQDLRALALKGVSENVQQQVYFYVGFEGIHASARQVLADYEHLKGQNHVFFSGIDLMETNWDSVPVEIVQAYYAKCLNNQGTLGMTNVKALTDMLQETMRFLREIRAEKNPTTQKEEFPPFAELTQEQYEKMVQILDGQQTVIESDHCPTCQSDETYSLNDFLDRGLDVRSCEDCKETYEVHYKTVPLQKKATKKG